MSDPAFVGALEAWLEFCLADHTDSRHLPDLSVADLTWWLTEQIFYLARNIDTVAGYPVTGVWRTRRELTLPVIPDSRSAFGRADVIVMRSDASDVVIEIDSAHNDASVTKLAFARDAGAIAVWVRWHGGRVQTPPGIAVLDLVERTRRLAAGGA